MIVKDKYQNLQRIIDIQDRDNSYLICQKDNKYGVLKNSECIVNNEYSNIEYDSLDQLFIVEKDNKYGILKNDGSILISVLYDYKDIEGIYIYAQKDNENIIFNNNGEKEENLNYKSAFSVENSEYKITINKDNKYGVINNNGDILIPNDYYYIGYLINNNFIVSGENGKNGIINSNGEVILKTKYDTIQKLENSDFIEVQNLESNITYLYNSNIEKIAEMENGTIQEGDNYVKIYSLNEIKYFNLSGEEKTNKELLKENTLFADVKNGKWGFVDKDGNVRIEYQYDEVTEFNKYGFAGIKKDGKWGSINQNGIVVVEPKYVLNSSNKEIDFIGQYYKFIYGYKKFYYTDIAKEE